MSQRLATPIALWIVAVIATLWFLRTARALLIPVALAVLISYTRSSPQSPGWNGIASTG